MTRVAFTADVPPLGTNHAYRPARWGRRHGFTKTDEAHAYQEQLRVAARRAMAGRAPFAGACDVVLRFVFPANRGDIDGPVKLTLDALQGVAIVNDRQVQAFRVERALDRDRPRVEVEVLERAAATGETTTTSRPRRAKASALAENAHELLFTGKRTARERSLAVQRRAVSSRRSFR